MSSTTINRYHLPSELLVTIFEECVALAHGQDGLAWCHHACTQRCLLDWVYITHVCRRWRAIALAQPSLWSHLVLLYPAWAKEMLARAKTAPLTVSLGEQGQWHTERLADLLYPEWREERWIRASAPGQMFLTEEQMREVTQNCSLEDFIQYPDPVTLELINQRAQRTMEMFAAQNAKKSEDMKAAAERHSKRVSTSGPLIQSFSSLYNGTHPHNNSPAALDFLMLHSCRLTRMHLRSAFYGLDIYEHLVKMDMLEELVLDQCLLKITGYDLWGISTGDPPARIHLPSLKSLRIKDALHYAAIFASKLRTARPLRCLTVENHAEDFNHFFSLKCPPHAVSASIRTFVAASTRSPVISAHEPSAFPDHHCILRAEGQWCPGSRPRFQLTAWRRETTEPSDIISWERNGKLPHLPSIRPSTQSHASMSAFYKTDPALHFYSPIDADESVDWCTLNALRAVFSLHSVVFATIKVLGHWLLIDDQCDLTRESATAFLAEMTSLRVLEVFKHSAARLADALTPRDGQYCVLAPELEELWLEEIDFASDSLMPAALVRCVAARAAYGRPLRKLMLRNCKHIDAEELMALTHWHLDVEEKFVQPETEPQVFRTATGNMAEVMNGSRGKGRGASRGGRSRKKPARGMKKQQK